jgi:hypothetical protein
VSAVIACEFFTVDAAFLRRYYVLLFIDIQTRRLYFADTTRNADGPGSPTSAKSQHDRRPGHDAA